MFAVWIEICLKYTKKNRKDNYMKMVQENNCWSFQTKVMNIISEDKVNVNELCYKLLL